MRLNRRTALRTLLAASAGVGAAALLPAPARADYQTTIDPNITWGTWEGWGTSLAWWAQAFGDRDDLAYIFFTRDDVPYYNKVLPGLGFNIARYNAGACSWDAIGSDRMQVSPNIRRSRQMEGFWLDWYSADPESASWDWSVDANQREMLRKARACGADTFELFSNSPMWWMCNNHNPSGSGLSNNLQPWNYRQHAVYLATIAQRAQQTWGIDFTSVEPFNEPIADWWRPDGTQEGCYFDRLLQRDIIGYLRTELDLRKLGSVKVSAADENNIDDAYLTWFWYDSATRDKVGRINVHGYEYGGGRRDRLYAAAQGKPIWMSEYGEDKSSGLDLATNLNLDMRWLHPTAWVYWQVLDYGGWGLIQADAETRWLGPVNPKYYVLAQFSRHIRPGMQIIDSGDANTVAAYDPNFGSLVVVCTNYGTGQWINFELGKFRGRPAEGALVQRWATQTDGSELYGYHDDTFINGTRFWSWFEPNTVQTFLVENIWP